MAGDTQAHLEFGFALRPAGPLVGALQSLVVLRPEGDELPDEISPCELSPGYGGRLSSQPRPTQQSAAQKVGLLSAGWFCLQHRFEDGSPKRLWNLLDTGLRVVQPESPERYGERRSDNLYRDGRWDSSRKHHCFALPGGDCSDSWTKPGKHRHPAI